MRDASVLRNGARVRCEDPKWPGVGTIVAAIFEVSWDDGLLVRHAAETLRGVEDQRTEPAVVSVRQIGGEQGPWRLFVGEHGVATWPSQAANEDPEHYAKEVARCVRLALQRSGEPVSGLRQAWCVSPGCPGGAKVGKDCPLAMLSCIACGAPLTFDEPQRRESPCRHLLTDRVICERCGDVLVADGAGGWKSKPNTPGIFGAKLDGALLNRVRVSLREAYGALANRRQMSSADLDLIERDMKAFEASLSSSGLPKEVK